jgi:hypothetical protein
MAKLMVVFAMSRKRKHLKQLLGLTESPSVEGWTESVRSSNISLSFVVFFFCIKVRDGGGGKGDRIQSHLVAQHRRTERCKYLYVLHFLPHSSFFSRFITHKYNAWEEYLLSM